MGLHALPGPMTPRAAPDAMAAAAHVKRARGTRPPGTIAVVAAESARTAMYDAEAWAMHADHDAAEARGYARAYVDGGGQYAEAVQGQMAEAVDAARRAKAAAERAAGAAGQALAKVDEIDRAGADVDGGALAAVVGYSARAQGAADSARLAAEAAADRLAETQLVGQELDEAPEAP